MGWDGTAATLPVCCLPMISFLTGMHSTQETNSTSRQRRELWIGKQQNKRGGDESAGGHLNLTLPAVDPAGPGDGRPRRAMQMLLLQLVVAPNLRLRRDSSGGFKAATLHGRKERRGFATFGFGVDSARTSGSSPRPDARACLVIRIILLHVWVRVHFIRFRTHRYAYNNWLYVGRRSM